MRRTFWSVAKAPSQRQFESCLNQLEELPHGMEVSEYIRAIPFKRWANFPIERPRYGHRTSNIAESINSSWKDSIREASITEALKGIWLYLTRKFHDPRNTNFKSPHFTNSAYQHIHDQSALSRHYRVVQGSN